MAAAKTMSHTSSNSRASIMIKQEVQKLFRTKRKAHKNRVFYYKSFNCKINYQGQVQGYFQNDFQGQGQGQSLSQGKSLGQGHLQGQGQSLGEGHVQGHGHVVKVNV